MKLKKKASLLFLCTLFGFLCSCSFFTVKGPAPKKIANTKISFTYNKTDIDFKSLEGQTVTYTFYKNLTYKAYIGKKPYSEGDYAYNRTNGFSGELTLSYIYKGNVEEIILHLYFSDAHSGGFDEIPYSQHLKEEAGTFRLVSLNKTQR